MPSKLGCAVAAALLVVATSSAQSIFTLAGGERADGYPATLVSLNNLTNVAVAPNGDIYIAETRAHRVRKVDAATGIITTAAGNGVQEDGGDGGPAKVASLNNPEGVAVDDQGNLYIADTMNYRVRRVDATSGLIRTIAGGGDATPAEGLLATEVFLGGAEDVAIAGGGELHFIARNRVWRIDSGGRLRIVAGNGSYGFGGDGGPATQAPLNNPTGIAIDAEKQLFIADRNNERIRKVDRVGVITTVAGGGTSRADGIPATDAKLFLPNDVAVDLQGSIYYSDTYNYIKRIDPLSGLISTYAGNGFAGSEGDGGPATAARLDGPKGLAIDLQGNLLIALSPAGFDVGPSNRIRRVDAGSGIISTVAGGAVAPLGDGGPATMATFDHPKGVAVDGEGNIFVADTYRHRVRKISRGSGFIITVAGNGSYNSAGDGGPATAASVGFPADVAVDAMGNLYISQSSLIRRVTPEGTISRFAGTGSAGFSGDGGPATTARLDTVNGLALDPQEQGLYLVDRANNRVRRIDLASGIITTVAGNGLRGYTGDGGPATAARMDNPWDVAIDAAGNLFIADTINDRIRRVSAETGIISTVAGNGNGGFSGDGGSATGGQLDSPTGVAVDAQGNLFIADQFNDRVRKVTAGMITTYAGRGTRGLGGDEGAATAAAIGYPVAVSVDRSGGLYILQSDVFSSAFAVRYVPACIAVTAPQLLSPASGSSGVATFPRLAWRAVPGAFSY
ncbi:MAG TPA: hypothetical protein VM534_01125, partial [Thermoanaerobaculia bacterium]|nr:hypothetical protein [Thermoanaerobaculia bacterium]